MGAAKGKPSWNAGTGQGWIDRRGYRWIRVAGRSVREHRHVMEVALGRALSDSEIVHHVDGNKLNNAIGNLEIMKNGDHTRVHHVGAKRPDQSKKAMRRAARDRQTIRSDGAALNACQHALGMFLGCLDDEERKQPIYRTASAAYNKAEKAIARAAIAKATGGAS